jgi:hypothetical protein
VAVNKKTNNFSRNGGQIVIVTLILFLVTTLTLVLGIAYPVTRDIKSMQELVFSKESYFLAEAAQEDVIYRAKWTLNYPQSEAVLIGSHSVNVDVDDTSGDIIVTALGNQRGHSRKVQTVLSEGTGFAFIYGIQAGNGGFRLFNNASITGSVFSNGTIIGAANTIRGDVISAGASGLVEGIKADGSVYANTIRTTNVGVDAYYKTIESSVVSGSHYPNSEPQEPVELPISDETIDEWRDHAGSVQVINPASCPYVIDSSRQIGPTKIACDTVIRGNSTVLTLKGALWVEGNITFQNNPTVRAHPGLGSRSVVIIADNPANRDNSGIINIPNSVKFQGTGRSGSYVMLISQNSSAENGGTVSAITVENHVEGDLLVYAGHGEVRIRNNVELREVTAYRVRAENFAEVIYETGLSNVLFSAGPAGGYDILFWQEVE